MPRHGLGSKKVLVAGRIANDAQIRPAAGQLVQRLAGGQLLNAGVKALLRRPGRQIAGHGLHGRRGLRQADIEPVLRLAAGVQGVDLIGLPENVVGVAQEGCTPGRGPHAAAGPVEDGEADGLLHFVQHAAEIGLAHVQGFRRLGNGAGAFDFGDVAQM